MLINKAIEIAAKAHNNQTDKAGEPYILHPLRVMLSVKGETEQCAAVLHDVLEDTDITEEYLISEGFSLEIIDALRLLTRKKEDDYMEYISRLKSNRTAKAVKLADLTDNMNISRIKNPTEVDYMRIEKYKRAQSVLMTQ